MSTANACLTNPSLILRNEPRVTIEIAVDQLPAAMSDWHGVVAGITRAWVTRKNYARAGTLWGRGSPSFNFQGEEPTWVEWVVVCGLPAEFQRHLGGLLAARTSGAVRGASDYASVNRSDGWAPILHIEGGAVWRPVDEFTWCEA